MADRIPIGSPVRTQAIINRYLGKTKKKLGQNFLVDHQAIMGIVKAAKIHPGAQVIEIGPGIGSLTEELLLAGAKVFAYEVDPVLPPLLYDELPQTIDGQPLAKRFKVILKSILKANFKKDIADFFNLQQGVQVVANLPYYITTPIIFALADDELHFTSLTLMMQKEVAARVGAKPGHKTYGPLTLAVQVQMQARVALTVKRHSFMPHPQVDSSVVVLTPLTKPLVKAENRRHFNWVVKMCFGQRRKTLLNNLKPLFQDKKECKTMLQNLSINPQLRPGVLTINQFVALANEIPAPKSN